MPLALGSVLMSLTACQPEQPATDGLPLATAASHADHDHDHREAGAHVHGAGDFTLVLEGNSLNIGFVVPAIDILGFEHLPANDTERQQLQAMVDLLATPASLLNLPEAANCQLQDARVTSLVLDEGAVSHGDFELHYEWLCQSTAQLSALTLTLFDRFPSLQQLQGSWIVHDRQGAQVFSPDRPTFTF